MLMRHHLLSALSSWPFKLQSNQLLLQKSTINFHCIKGAWTDYGDWCVRPLIFDWSETRSIFAFGKLVRYVRSMKEHNIIDPIIIFTISIQRDEFELMVWSSSMSRPIVDFCEQKVGPSSALWIRKMVVAHKSSIHLSIGWLCEFLICNHLVLQTDE